MKALREFVCDKERFVVGHRGSSGTAPENTLSSFSEAIQVGVAMVEVDIQITNDKKIVSFHDSKLERTSNGKGRISDLNYDNLSLLDAGSWFNLKFQNEKIPLLSEVIDIIKDKAFLNIEIKGGRNTENNENIKLVLESVFSKNYQEQTLFSSFDYKALKSIKLIDDNIPTAAIRLPGDKRLPSQIASEISCEAFVCELSEINKEISEDAFKNGIFIGVYSIDNLQQLNDVLKYNVQAIVSNFPALIINEMKNKFPSK